MKNKDLIAKLSKFPEDMEIVIHHEEQSVYHADAEPSNIGLYPEFKVCQLPEDNRPEGGKTFVMLTFNDPTYVEEVEN